MLDALASTTLRAPKKSPRRRNRRSGTRSRTAAGTARSRLSRPAKYARSALRRADTDCRRAAEPARCAAPSMKVLRRDLGSVDDHVRRDRQVAVDALADGHRVVLRGDDVGIAPDRDAAPAFARRKEFPVADRVAGGAVGDVVGGERELVDVKQHLARLQLGQLRGRRTCLRADWRD